VQLGKEHTVVLIGHFHAGPGVNNAPGAPPVVRLLEGCREGTALRVLEKYFPKQKTATKGVLHITYALNAAG
jgi:hypothetical protein